MPRKLTVAALVTIASVALVAYHPALKIGFYLDDWWDLEAVGRTGVYTFVADAFNPTMYSAWPSYRPLLGTLIGLEYLVLGGNPVWYHFVQITIHLLNSLLVYLVTRHVLGVRSAVLAGIFFASLPVFCRAVFLPTAADLPLTTFYLLAVWSWILYLRSKQGLSYILTIVAFALALLTKELGATLPAVLLLVDRFFISDKASARQLFHRYSPFAVIVAAYGMLELYIQPHTVNASAYKMSLGVHVLDNLVRYVEQLAFPLYPDPPNSTVPAWIAFALFIIFILWKRNAAMIALGVAALVNIIPVLGFQSFVFQSRFLYLPGIAPAVLLASLLDTGSRKWRLPLVSSGLLSIFTVALLFVNSAEIADAAQAQFEDSYVRRALLRHISQRYPTLAPDTYLYFIEPWPTTAELSGMFFMKYGPSVTVQGTDVNAPALWRDHRNTLIYYFDAERNPLETKVLHDAQTIATPDLPLVLDSCIRLEGYEVSSNLLRPDGRLVLMLYWRASKRLDKDYTVFVHLVDSAGNTVAGYDSQPAEGRLPTSQWKPGSLILDSIIMPIAHDVPPGQGYHLEIGMYYLPTMEQLTISAPYSSPVTDHVDIAPFEVH